MRAQLRALTERYGLPSDRLTDAASATLLAYEYRAMEKLYASPRGSSPVRTCGVRPRSGGANATAPICGTGCCTPPEDYINVPPEYRLWIWPDDVATAVSRLKLVPAPALSHVE